MIKEENNINNNEEIEEEKWTLSYSSLINTIIRPPRSNHYTPDDLCSPNFEYQEKKYERIEITLSNKKNYKLQCSIIKLIQQTKTKKKRPIVIYLHGNSSNREEGMLNVPLLLRHGLNVFLFDFSGSGLSEGEYISLGYNEADDLEVVINYLSNQPDVGRIGVWGRSMGAATALMYLYKDNRIKAAVVDSPFGDFKVLAKQLCKKFKHIPDILFNITMYFVKGTIKEKCGFDIENLKPIEHAKLCNAPIFFIHAMNDELIPLEHSVKLYEEYGGKKILNVCAGGHHTKRDKDLLEKVGNFFSQHLCK